MAADTLRRRLLELVQTVPVILLCLAWIHVDHHLHQADVDSKRVYWVGMPVALACFGVLHRVWTIRSAPPDARDTQIGLLVVTLLLAAFSGLIGVVLGWIVESFLRTTSDASTAIVLLRLGWHGIVAFCFPLLPRLYATKPDPT